MLIFVHIIQPIYDYGYGPHTRPVGIHQIASIIVYVCIFQIWNRTASEFPFCPPQTATSRVICHGARRNTGEMVIYHIYLGRTSCTCTGARVQDPNAICFALWLSSILWPELETHTHTHRRRERKAGWENPAKSTLHPHMCASVSAGFYVFVHSFKCFA